jgi:hypothetical protein
VLLSELSHLGAAAVVVALWVAAPVGSSFQQVSVANRVAVRAVRSQCSSSNSVPFIHACALVELFYILPCLSRSVLKGRSV